MEESFLVFCNSVKRNSTDCTSKTLKKICTDCKILTKNIDINRVDIEFAAFTKGTLKVDYAKFEQFVRGPLAKLFAQGGACEDKIAEELIAKIAQGKPTGHGTTSGSNDQVTSRLTDHKGYTGSHKERFDIETGSGKGKAGREELVSEKAKSGYVGAYKEMGTYDKKH